MVYVALVLALLSPAPSGGFGPRIESRGKTHKLVMPKLMWAALQKHAPSFVAFEFADYASHLFRPGLRWHYKVTAQQAPFAVIGDFNGDRVKDVIIDGCTETSCGMVALLSQGKRFVASDVEPGAPQAPGYPRPTDHPLEDVLRLVRPGVIHSPHLEPKPLILKNDAVERIYPEKASAIHYYTGDRHFATYTTAD